MAEKAQQQPRRASATSTGLTWVWMFVAVLSIAGLLTWLAMVSEPSALQVVVEEQEDDIMEIDGQAVRAIPSRELQGDPQALVGQLVQVRDLSVVGRVGAQAFWVALPDENPYLVKLDTALTADGFSVQGGDMLTLAAGWVHAMSDSVVAAWREQGAFTDEMEEMEVMFATTFLEAVRARKESAASDGEEDAADGVADAR